MGNCPHKGQDCQGSHDSKQINLVRAKRGLPPFPIAATQPTGTSLAFTKGGKSDSKGGKNRDGKVDKRKDIPCRNMLNTGTCKFGDKCIFNHNNVTSNGAANVVNGQVVNLPPKAKAKSKAKAKGKGDKNKKLAMCILESGEDVPISELIGEELGEDEVRTVEIDD